MKLLTGTGLFLAFCALGLLAMAICTDYWYETDARRHRERCKNYANKRNDPGYIYISNHNLPLQMPPRSAERRGGGPDAGAPLVRWKRHFLAAASAMESHCNRQFNSTVSGLWRKCHREGFDLETEDLIYKGKQFFFLSVSLSLLMGGSGSSSAVHQAQMLSDELILRAASSTGLAKALALMCLSIVYCMFYLFVYLFEIKPPPMGVFCSLFPSSSW